jgi:hypothetical protein
MLPATTLFPAIRFRLVGRLLLLLTALLLVVVTPSPSLNAASTAGAPMRIELPRGWTVYRDQSGLVVLHPRGWQVRPLNAGSFFVFCPDKVRGATAIAYVMPLGSIQSSPADVLQRLGRKAPDVFPHARIFGMRNVSRDPAVAIANLHFSPNGLPFVGSVLCYAQAGRGVVYAIAAERGRWSRDRSTLRRILTSFFYSTTGGKPPSTRIALPRMVTWREPVENAFSVPVPEKWHVQGGIRRLGATAVPYEVVVLSPERRIQMRVGDVSIPVSFAAPNQLLAQMGLSEGQWCSPDGQGTGSTYILRYLPGAQFLVNWYLPRTVGQFRITRQDSFRWLSEQATRIMAQAGVAAQMLFEGVNFDAQTAQGLRKGYAFVGTMGMLPNWGVVQFGMYLSLPETEALAEAVLQRMLVDFRSNPQWINANVRTAGRLAQIQSDTNREINDMMAEGYRRRSAIQDRTQEKWSRAMRGETLIGDPNTGQHFEVPSGHDYYWRVNGGEQFVGTDQPAPPNLPNHWVEQMEVVN